MIFCDLRSLSESVPNFAPTRVMGHITYPFFSYFDSRSRSTPSRGTCTCWRTLYCCRPPPQRLRPRRRRRSSLRPHSATLPRPLRQRQRMRRRPLLLTTATAIIIFIVLFPPTPISYSSSAFRRRSEGAATQWTTRSVTMF